MAAPGASARLVGAERFNATIQLAANDIDEMDRAAAITVSTIVAAARVRAPVDTGALASSISGSVDSDSVVHVTSTASYAGVVHWGVRSRGVPGRPFLLQAGWDTEAVWVNGYLADINAALRRVHGA